jgi:hypothetical protein
MAFSKFSRSYDPRDELYGFGDKGRGLLTSR